MKKLYKLQRKYQARPSYTVDILHGNLWSSLSAFAIPIALAGILQQLFHLADTAVVGRFADTNALAAVGVNGELTALLVSLSGGLAVGVNVLTAHAIGSLAQSSADNSEIKQRISNTADSGSRSTSAVNRNRAVQTVLPNGSDTHSSLPRIFSASIRIALVWGIFLTVIGQFLAVPILQLMQTPEEILTSAVTYFRIYLIGYPFLLLYDFGAAMLRGKGDSLHPTIAIVFSGVINVLLNLFFVLVLHFGVAGVAIATVLSNIVSAILVIIHSAVLSEDLSTDSVHTRHTWNLLPFRASSATKMKVHRPFTLHAQTAQTTAQILRIGIPAALQSAVFCFANIFVQSAVNQLGASVIAGATIAMNYEYLTFYILTAFGQAATSFTGQNMAAGNISRCRKILLYSIWEGMILCGICTTMISVFHTAFAGFFSTDPAAVEAAGTRILITVLWEPIYAVFEGIAGALRGRGKAIVPAVIAIFGTCVFRIVWVLTVFAANPAEHTLYAAFPLSWIIIDVSIGIYYRACQPTETKE